MTWKVANWTSRTYDFYKKARSAVDESSSMFQLEAVIRLLGSTEQSSLIPTHHRKFEEIERIADAKNDFDPLDHPHFIALLTQVTYTCLRIFVYKFELFM